MDEPIGTYTQVDVAGMLLPFRIDGSIPLFADERGRRYVPVFSDKVRMVCFLTAAGISRFSARTIADGPGFCQNVEKTGFGIAIDPYHTENGMVRFWKMLDDWETPVSPN